MIFFKTNKNMPNFPNLFSLSLMAASSFSIDEFPSMLNVPLAKEALSIVSSIANCGMEQEFRTSVMNRIDVFGLTSVA